MRFLTALAAMAVAAASAEPDLTATPDIHDAEENPDVTVLEDGKNYVVKLDCLGCPFGLKQDNGRVSWLEPPQDNALRLQVAVHTKGRAEPALLLNGRNVLPLEPMPLNINAFQVPANISEDDLVGFQPGSTFTRGVQVPLQYEHAVLRTHGAGTWWVQFDVTGLPLDKINDPSVVCGGQRQPVALDKEDQKLIQILVRHTNGTQEIVIEHVQTVLRKDRAQPLRMKCGNLAIAQTKYDPHEWDEYGKLGSWSRYQTMVAEMWFELENSPFTLLLALVLAFGIVAIRRWRMQGHRANASAQEDAEIALMVTEYEDALPAYANIPVIKIEEYD